MFDSIMSFPLVQFGLIKYLKKPLVQIEQAWCFFIPSMFLVMIESNFA
jgi:hypothetical protein